MHIKNRTIGKLKAIKDITHNHQDSRYPIASIFIAIKAMVNMKKYEKESLEVFNKSFKNARDII